MAEPFLTDREQVTDSPPILPSVRDKKGSIYYENPFFNVIPATELFKLLVPIHDVAHIETHPTLSFESLGAFFQGTL